MIRKIILIAMLLTSPLFAGEKAERVFKGKGVNDILEEVGGEIHSITHFVNDAPAIAYHLYVKPDGDLVTCIVGYGAVLKRKTVCYKP
tara:strand:+ start:227 stop:490 length:264 start_codon:yes stop_codon:yes gene_type:complete